VLGAIMSNPRFNTRDKTYWHQKGLANLIQSWGLIKWYSFKDSYELSNKLIGKLENGASRPTLSTMLNSELIANYGLDISNGQVDKYVDQIWNWWRQKN